MDKVSHTDIPEGIKYKLSFFLTDEESFFLKFSEELGELRLRDGTVFLEFSDGFWSSEKSTAEEEALRMSDELQYMSDFIRTSSEFFHMSKM